MNAHVAGDKDLTLASEDEPRRYQVQEKAGWYDVVDGAGAVVCSCGSQANAQQYVALLTQAYRRGYRLGYRQAKHGRDEGC